MLLQALGYEPESVLKKGERISHYPKENLKKKGKKLSDYTKESSEDSDNDETNDEDQ